MKKSINDLLDSHEELGVFRDIANASKHVALELEKPAYKNHPPVIKGEVEESATPSYVVHGVGPKYRLKVTIKSGIRLSVNEWADKAIHAWEEFFKTHKI